MFDALLQEESTVPALVSKAHMATKVNADHLPKLSKTHSNVATSVKLKTSKAHATASRLKLDISRNPNVKQVPARTQAVAQRVTTRTATIDTRSAELAKRADYVREQAAKSSSVKTPTKSVVMGKASASADAMHRTANKLGATTRARPKAPTVKTPTSRATSTRSVPKLRPHPKPRPKRVFDAEATVDLAATVVDFSKEAIKGGTTTITKPVPRTARRSPSRSSKPAAKRLALARVQASPAPKRGVSTSKAPNRTMAKPAAPQARRPQNRTIQPARKAAPRAAQKRVAVKRALPGSAPRTRAKAPAPQKILSYKPKLSKAYKPILGPARNLAKPARALSGAGRVLGVLDLGMTAQGQYTASRSQGRTKKQAAADAALKTGFKATGAFIGGRIGGVAGGAACSPVPILVPLCYAAGSVAGSYLGGKASEAAYARMRPAPRRKPPIHVPPRRR
jgi:hypothetical protein